MLLAGSAEGFGQERSPVDGPGALSAGIFGGRSMVRYSADFAVSATGELTPFTGCGKFTRGTGAGWIVGGTFGRGFGSGLRLGVAPDLEFAEGTLTYPCVDPARIRLPDGTTTAAETEFAADISYTGASIRLFAEWSPFPTPLSFSAGPVVSAILQSSYDVHEDITAPTSAEFVEGGQSRTYGRDEFDPAGVAFGLDAGISYHAPISSALALVPSVGVRGFFSDEMTWGNIRSTSVRFTLGVERAFVRDDSPPVAIEPVTSQAPVVEAPPPLSSALAARSMGVDGTLSDTVVIRLHGTTRTDLNPLLPYIFFERGERNIPSRYTANGMETPGTFSESTFGESNPLAIYRRILDIVGSRMRRNEKATLTLSGVELTEESGGISRNDLEMGLGLSRAVEVKGYLVRVWGIAEDRITTSGRTDQMPAGTQPGDEQRLAERRRVELVASDPAILTPVRVKEFTSAISYPDLKIRPEITGGNSETGWTIRATYDGVTFDVARGAGPAPASISWDTEPLARSEAAEGRLELRLDVTGAGGGATSRSSIPVRIERRSESSTEGRALLLFEYAGDRLLMNQEPSSTMLAGLTFTDTVNVVGHTDRLGETDANRELSRRRAEAVARWIDRAVLIQGRGEESVLFDNTTPEGRFYSRSVVVESARRP